MSVVSFFSLSMFFVIPFSYDQIQPDDYDAVNYIVSSFETCNIIGISEGPHGLDNSHAFFRKMFEDKRIQNTVNIIIVEFASVAYQDILDNFIEGGEVDKKDIQKIWQESGQNHDGHWDRPIYFQFLEQIRSMNLNLPPDKHIRVLAGDPAIEWKSVTSIQDYFRYLPQRDLFPARIAIEYGIYQNKKVLLIYGDTHLTKINDRPGDSTHWVIPFIINKQKSNSMKTIGIFYTDRLDKIITNPPWPAYSVIDLSKNDLGNMPAKQFYPEFIKYIDSDGSKLRVKDIYDALLYVGDQNSWKISPITPNAFKDDEYWKELNRRSLIIWGEPIDEKMRH